MMVLIGYSDIGNYCFHEPIQTEATNFHFGVELFGKVLCSAMCQIGLHGCGTKQQNSSQRRKQQGEDNDQYYVNRFFDTFVA